MIACLCWFECRDCSLSGHEWHQHDGDEPCPIHADVLVVG